VGRALLGVGIVGLGAIGRVHAENLLHGVPGARLVRVADSSAGAREWVRRTRDVPASRSAADLLEDRAVDAVVIATPPATHPELVELAARADKAILCEKPLALDIGGAERAVSAAARADVPLQVGFHRRFDPDFRLAKARIQAGELGAVYSFFGSMRDATPPGPDPSWGAAQALIHDAACHDLDGARWLVGEIDELSTVGASVSSAALREAGQIDHAITVLRFASGALGSIDNGLASGYGFDCRCEIVGSEATIRLDHPFTANIEWLARGRSGFERTPTFLHRFARTYPIELEAFVQAVRSASEVPVTGEDGLAAVVLAVASQRSLETGASVRLSRTGQQHTIAPDQPRG
jgi:myo-inositol 2-dehydrogenase / D-chiro-inositol 1-dehydrogenase